MQEIVYLNGALTPRGQAKVPVLDYGFLYGYGLFETMRAYNGTVFRLESHLHRLAKSADKLGIPVEIEKLNKAINDTLRANGLKEARVRLTVSAGEGGAVPDPCSCKTPTVLVMATSLNPYSKEIYEKGLKVIISSIRRNSLSPISGMKTTNYLENILARQEATTKRANEAILLNEKGSITEASFSNVFIVNKDILKTPVLESGILPGITRSVVQEIAHATGIVYLETNIQLGKLTRADEVFLTNSIMEIMPVIMIDGKQVGNGRPGIITRKLMGAYRQLVKEETSG